MNSIEDIEANVESKRLESGLANAEHTVVAWWNEHGAGFQRYPFRVPTGKWKQRNKTSDILELDEIEGKHRFRWMASFGQATGYRWKLFYWCAEPYGFTWTVDVSGDQAKIVEVKITSPIPDWVVLTLE